MFKSIIIAIACLAAVPVFTQNEAIAQSNVIAQSTTYRRSPEAIERQRERERLRLRQARRRQLEWRRKYGDLAPSRQRSERD
jgi:hypothetical protein